MTTKELIIEELEKWSFNTQSISKYFNGKDRPHYSTVYRLINKDSEVKEYFRSCQETKGLVLGDDLNDVVEKLQNDEMSSEVAKVVVNVRQFQATKLSGYYNDKKQVNLTGNVETTIVGMVVE